MPPRIGFSRRSMIGRRAFLDDDASVAREGRRQQSHKHGRDQRSHINSCTSPSFVSLLFPRGLYTSEKLRDDLKHELPRAIEFGRSGRQRPFRIGRVPVTIRRSPNSVPLLLIGAENKTKFVCTSGQSPR